MFFSYGVCNPFLGCFQRNVDSGDVRNEFSRNQDPIPGRCVGCLVRIDPNHRHNNAFLIDGETEMGTPDSGR